MRVLHCCLAAFYIDKFGYQENILPKMHKLQGHDVKILASTENYLENRYLGYVQPGRYNNENGIEVTRISYTGWLPHKLAAKLRIYKGLKRELEVFKPEIIFLHDVQFLSIITVARYAKQNKVIIFADSHTDFINSGRNFLSKYILHKLIYRFCAKVIEPYVKCFYGTLPLRVSFLNEVYGIAQKKIKLLPFGFDDTEIKISDRQSLRIQLIKTLELNEDDFIVISGGKIDRRKNFDILIEAVKCIGNEKVKLLIFGSATPELENLLQSINLNRIKWLGWLDHLEIQKYLLISDLGFFPGTHSVLWEMAIGLGLPCVLNYWDGFDHLDLGGNVKFLEEVNKNKIEDAIREITEDQDLFHKMRIAAKKGSEVFAYSKIAEKSIIIE